MPGRMPPTSQLDWLISTTAMIVLFWSRATRDLLKSFGWGIATLHRLIQRRSCHPRRPPHSISPLGAEVVCRDFVRIEPDAHGVLAGALELDIADTLQACQHVLHVQGCIVRQVQSVARFVRRIEVNGHKYARYRLSHLHAQALDVLWQARQCTCTRFWVSICAML